MDCLKYLSELHNKSCEKKYFPRFNTQFLKFLRQKNNLKYIPTIKNIIDDYCERKEYNQLIEETFQENAKLIYTLRDPLYILETYSSYIDRIRFDPREFTPKISFKNISFSLTSRSVLLTPSSLCRD